MADKTDPALAEEQASVAADPAPTPAGPSEPETPAPTPLARAGDPKADAIAALIRNGLGNSPISQSETAWLALETRLPQIVAAIAQLEA